MSATARPFMTFRVVAPWPALGLEPGGRLYIRLGFPTFTVLASDHTSSFPPADYGAVLSAALAGCLEQVAGLFMAGGS